MEHDVSQPMTLSVPQAAALLGISPRTVYILARRADFPAFRISPRRIIVGRAGLEHWIQQQIKIKE